MYRMAKSLWRIWFAFKNYCHLLPSIILIIIRASLRILLRTKILVMIEINKNYANSINKLTTSMHVHAINLNSISLSHTVKHINQHSNKYYHRNYSIPIHAKHLIHNMLKPISLKNGKKNNHWNYHRKTQNYYFVKVWKGYNKNAILHH